MREHHRLLSPPQASRKPGHSTGKSRPHPRSPCEIAPWPQQWKHLTRDWLRPDKKAKLLSLPSAFCAEQVQIPAWHWGTGEHTCPCIIVQGAQDIYCPTRSHKARPQAYPIAPESPRPPSPISCCPRAPSHHPGPETCPSAQQKCRTPSFQGTQRGDMSAHVTVQAE